MAALRAPSSQMLGATPQMAAGRRNPKGWVDPRRRAALLVVGVALLSATLFSSRLARLAARPSATMRS